MDVYSNAFNYRSYIAGSVDVRTGQFGCQIKLAALSPQGPLEVSREVILGFSMLGGVGGLYGLNWHLSNTQFDSAKSRLTLLTGERYQTQGLPSVGARLVIKDRKLEDLVVKRVDTNTLHVIYKDGTVEILRRTSSTTPYRIVALLFENGERFSWHYDTGDALERILNHNQEELLVLTYSGGRLSMADTRVDGNRYARTRFTYTNGRLTSVTVPYDRTEPPGTQSYTFGYTQPFRNGLVAINRVGTPMGGVESISYVEMGHQYGNGQYLPRVASWVQTAAAGQPDIARTYSYSPDRNFTGYPFRGGFTEGVDNLYLVPSPYAYWTEESTIDNTATVAALSMTRTTYNNFHLLTEEQVRREGTLVTTTIAYNTRPGFFPEQPANLQIPKTITKSFEQGSGGAPREEVQHIETDDYGNELSRTEASGVRTEYSYYPITGQPGKCPADPHGLFQRYVKQERLIPAGGTSVPPPTEYTYTSIQRAGTGYFVMQESSTQATVYSTRNTYYQTPVELAGRLKSISSTIDGLTSVSEISYAITGDNLIETRRLNGREGQWLESVRILSLVNRRLLSMTRDGGSTLTMAFDVNGRMTAETVSAGKPEQAGRRYAYHFATPTQRAHLITTDAQGSQVITYYDGLGRQISEAHLLGVPELNTGTWRYDALGQCVEEVHTDYLSDGTRTLETTYTYNRWGNLSRVKRPDGSVLIDEYDPLLNLKIEGVEGGERLKTWFNEHNQPAKVERLDVNDNSVEIESRTYDGLGRCLSVLDVGKNLTEFTYDAFNRQVTVLQKPADGTAQRLRKIEYARGTSSESATALMIDGKLVGAHTYDSLGRMISQVRGKGQAMILEYEAGWMEPASIVSPLGVREKRFYNRELNRPCRIEIAGRSVNTYRHDLMSGALTHSQTDGSIHEVVYDVNGNPEKDVQTVSGTSVTTLYDYSPGGRLKYQTTADGQRSQFDYDAHGRFLRMTTGSMVIEQDYDIFGRPQTLTAVYENTRVVTRITYDSLGREAERRFEQNGELLQVMTSEYHPNSMLAKRVFRDAKAQLLIGETFSYDAYLRLKTYRCEGREHPQDRLGRSIVGQNFSFDSLNNITQVVTSFVGNTQDVCERFFTGTDPTQLTRLTHTLPVQDVTLTYDAAGNLLVGPSGQLYTYNEFDQLTDIRADGFQYSYRYDAESRQVLAWRGNEQPVMLAYAGEHLESLVEGSKKIRYFNGDDQVMARGGGVDGPQLHTNDAAGSVRGISAPGQAHVRRQYTPYGYTKIPLDDGKTRTMADLQLPAFNGQRLDAASRLYFLGNGRRAYDPELMVFLQVDELTPFGKGGLNGYAYCACNPSNMVDPSGLWPSWLKWVLTGASLALSIVTVGFAAPALAAAVSAGAAGMLIASKAAVLVGAGLGVVSGTLSTAALGVAEVDKAMGWDRSNHINNLGWAAFGFSIASLAVGVGGAYTSAHMAYKGAAAKWTGVGNLSDTPIGSAVLASRDRMLGLTYKFTDKAGVTLYSQMFGGTRAILRFTNLGRSIESRSQTRENAVPEGNKGSFSASTQPQTQPALSSLKDMVSSSVEYFDAFRDEAWRIRQPILSGLIQGRGDA
ncbi:RHS repeat-associated core domain-containing protein [Pseudomonas khavaziana]|uniref:RHS repeat-associated core domain-containing protein n=1 Tax=Pseudomonas khavaziana TaxID=2842351 RepID=UPI001C3C5591|nr:RHS repeat-associated core domain-containing protein [Pseudomonas khavaziana]MBV4478480.1 RHS repeat-associated core domain-containing protein [Pseudomonas khavaziana]